MKPSSQRGMALLIVLWACTLLAILLGGYATIARIEAIQARHQFAETQAHYAAQAGVMRAIYELQAIRDQGPNPKQALWIGDGRPYAFELDRMKIKVSVTDEFGKVDLNSADPLVLQGLFVAAGVDTSNAQALAANIVEWRAAPLALQDTTAQQRYASAGRDYGPRHGPFASLEELQAVLGMNTAIYDKVLPAITLWSNQASPRPGTAPVLALAALPGMNLALAEQFIGQRNGAAPGALLTLPNGTAASVGGSGNAETIVAEAWTSDGVRAALRVTVRFELLREDLAKRIPSFTILRWQEDVGT